MSRSYGYPSTTHRDASYLQHSARDVVGGGARLGWSTIALSHPDTRKFAEMAGTKHYQSSGMSRAVGGASKIASFAHEHPQRFVAAAREIDSRRRLKPSNLLSHLLK